MVWAFLELRPKWCFKLLLFHGWVFLMWRWMGRQKNKWRYGLVRAGLWGQDSKLASWHLCGPSRWPVAIVGAVICLEQARKYLYSYIYISRARPSGTFLNTKKSHSLHLKEEAFSLHFTTFYLYQWKDVCLWCHVYVSISDSESSFTVSEWYQFKHLINRRSAFVLITTYFICSSPAA